MTTVTKIANPVEAIILAEPQYQDQLPAVITPGFEKSGDLIDSSSFTEEQKAQIEEVAKKFDITDTAQTLRFGAATQERASQYMDELLDDMKLGDAGVAGEILAEITAGVSLMNLKKVRNQIKNPPSWFAKFFAWVDYVKAFSESHKTVVSRFDNMKLKADNLIHGLTVSSTKMDQLVEGTEVQVGELRILIAAGERILELAREDYFSQREKVLSVKTPDSLKLASLIDYKDQIDAFHVRLVRIKTAFVESATTAIQQIRLTQKSIKIEIQNLDEAILFDLPSIKRAILQLGALKNLQDAQGVRKAYDKAQSDVQDVLGQTTQDTYEAAAKSQGDALRRVEQLSANMDKAIAGATKARELADETRNQRVAAEKMLIASKNQWDESMAEAAMKDV